MKITLVTDNPNSWIVPFAKELKNKLKRLKHKVSLVQTAKSISKGDITVLLSCEQIVPGPILKRSRYNLVVHESALPKGRGWAPLSWQILAGKNTVPITLFEAEASVDSGQIYLQKNMKFRGHELADELRRAQGEATIELVLEFVRRYSKIKGRKQKGKPSFYPRRRPQDSEIDPDKSIAEQFNLLRVVDNERYPVFFYHKGKKYILKIYKEEE